MRYVERFCWIMGIVLLSCFCGVKIEAQVFQMRSNVQLERILSTVSVTAPGPEAPVAEEPESSGSSLVGRIEIPRLKFASVIEEGDDPSILRTGVGHIPGTDLPGGNGNVGLAAHRDTFFRGLAKVKEGDVIVLTTPRGRFHYRVETTGIVPPSQTSVLRPVGVPALTLVTCYPFHYLGPAPDRYIITAFFFDDQTINDDDFSGQQVEAYGKEGPKYFQRLLARELNEHRHD